MSPDTPTPNDLLLQRYLDDELRPAERRELEARLAVEPELAEQLAELRAFSGLVRGTRPEPAPLGVGFAERAWARLREEERQAPAHSLSDTLRMWTLVAAALVVLLGAALWLLERDDPGVMTASPKKSEAQRLLDELDKDAKELPKPRDRKK